MESSRVADPAMFDDLARGQRKRLNGPRMQWREPGQKAVRCGQTLPIIQISEEHARYRMTEPNGE